MRKKLFTLLLATMASISALFAKSGTCGTNLTWDLTNGVLTISGTGEMYDYHNNVSMPWYSSRSSITSLIIGNSVTSIGDWAFIDCPGLTSVTIPNSVTSIGDVAFAECTGLTSVTIPNSVTSIGDYAFGGCTSLTSPVYNAHVFAFMPTTYSGAYTIPDGIESIAGHAFYRCTGLTSVTIPNSVTSIGVWAFADCTSLPIIDNIRYADTYLVKVVNRTLSSYTIKEGTKFIGDDAFEYCTSLNSITIPNSVTSIGTGTFRGCSGLTSVVWNAKHCTDFTSTSTPFYYYAPYNTTTYDRRSQITSFIFGDEVEYIPAYLCAGMSNAEITIENCKTEIGAHAFDDCNYTQEGIYNIVLPDTILCHRGAEICDSKGHCQVFESSGVFTCTYENIYGCDSIVFRNVIVKQDTTYLPDTLICMGESIFDGKEPQPFYESGVYNYTYINSEGCDSVISRNVYVVRHIVTPIINVKPAFDTPNSGNITIYKNTSGTPASFAYFTVNGIKHNCSSDNIGNGYSVNDLAEGTYRMVFYSILDCDSLVKNITIDQYGLRINGMYYLLDDLYHTATLTYRGTSYGDYSGEYSGNITIPKTITFEGKDYQVTGIKSYAFEGCNNIKSITMESETPISMYSSGLSNNCIIYVPYGSLNAYKSASGWRNYTIHVINPSHVTSTAGATSATITLGNTNEAQHIASCGMDGGEEEFAGNVIEYIGLEPNSEYANIPLFMKTKEGDMDNTAVSFATTALELTTKPSKPVSSTTAILLAETNMADAEVSCGFEWKRENAPDAMEGTKVYCPVASGQMAGRLKNLKDDVYYKYRAFYQSAAGNMYYGDWQYIFTGDVAVEFDPILYTYGATVVKENEATISGYALAGSEDFTEQGFEYWAETRANGGANAPHHMPAALGEHFFVQASGISLRVTLNNLDAGTVYKYRVYGKVGDQYYYGSEQSFTTQGTYEGDDLEAIEEVPRDPQSGIKAQKILRNGQIFILRGEKVYTITGQEVK